MAQSQKGSIKVGDKGKLFYDNLRTNRRQKIDGNLPTDKIDLSYWEMTELLKQFFEENNDLYLKLVKMEYKKQHG